MVERGKATRNLWEQVMLEAKHLVKEKLDKGYKEIEKPAAVVHSTMNRFFIKQL